MSKSISLFFAFWFLVSCTSTSPRVEAELSSETPNDKWAGVYLSFCRKNECAAYSEPLVHWITPETEEAGVLEISNLTLGISLVIMDKVSSDYRSVERVNLTSHDGLEPTVAHCRYRQHVSLSEMIVSWELLESPNPIVYAACLIEAVQIGSIEGIETCDDFAEVWRKSGEHLNSFASLLGEFVLDKDLSAEIKETQRLYQLLFEGRATAGVTNCQNRGRKV